MKVVIDRGDTTNNCDNKIELVPYATQAPYEITWWDNFWQPSTGLHAENICEGTILTNEIVDMNCRHLRSHTYIFPDSIPQVYLDTVIAVLASAPGLCDGSISFHYSNVFPSYTRGFGNGSSGGITLDSVFTNLYEDDYIYSIYGLTGNHVLGEVSVSLHYSPVLPCAPFSDSLVVIPQSSPGSCDEKITYNTSGIAGGAPYYHYIIKQVAGNPVQVNPNGPLGVDTTHSFTGLCSGPYIVDTKSFPSNNYFVNNTIFVDDPLVNDSTWGTPGSGLIDTIYLSVLIVASIILLMLIQCLLVVSLN